MSKLVVGAHVICLVNGRLLGQAIEADWEQASPHATLTGLDSLLPYEIAPVGAGMSGSIVLVRVHGDAALEGRGIIAPQALIPREKYFSLLLIDRVTGTKLLQADHCKVTSQKWRVAAKQRMSGSFSFQGIDAANELKF